MSRTMLVAGNWKMHHGGASACTLAAEVRDGVAKHDRVEVLVAPPFTAIAAVAHEVDGSRVGVAAQNLYGKDAGAFTGEVSAPMLRESGASWVILGHSERRQLFGETDALVAEKLAAALAGGLRPIVCVGETLAEREAGDTLAVLDRQVKLGLAGLTGDQIAALVIAYEPVWAIGTGKNATSAEAGEAHAHIRARLRQWFGGVPADRCRILYGGSVKPDNIRELIGLPDVDGALVGGASLEVRSFFEIVSRSL